MNFVLNDQIMIKNFIIKIYTVDTDHLDSEGVNSKIPELHDTESGKEIIDSLQNINGVSKIEVLDLDNNLLISSSKIIL